MGGFSRGPSLTTDADGRLSSNPPEEDVLRASEKSGKDPMAGAWSTWASQMDDFTSRIGPPERQTAIWDVDPPRPPEPIPNLGTWAGDALKTGSGWAASTIASEGASGLLADAPSLVSIGGSKMAGELVPNGRAGLARDLRIWAAWRLYDSASQINQGLRQGAFRNGIRYSHDFD